jgi:tetratricopeptide (TPR) repeat protein
MRIAGVTRRAVAKALRLCHFDGMKSFPIAVLLLAGLVFTARAQQEADDRYIGIYGLMQQADHLAETGDPGEALAAYTDVQSQLQQFQKTFPNWNPKILNFRLNQIAGKITVLKNQPGVAAALQKKQANAATEMSAVVGVSPPARPQSEAELDNLRAQLQSEQAANDQLQAKLKEALAVQPAAVDPRQLQRAQEKILWLMKKNALLVLSHAGAVPSNTTTQFITNVVTVFVTNNPVEVNSLAAVYAKNPQPVVVTNYVRVLVPDTNALEMARLDYAAAVKNLNAEHDRAEQLAAQLKQLRLQSASVTNDTSTLAGLRAENTRLKAELSALRATPPASSDDGKLAAELKQSQSLVASLRFDAEIAALEKKALEHRLRQLLTATNSGANAADYEARIRVLTLDRDSLMQKLDLATGQKAGGKNPKADARISALNNEVNVLRSRLAVAEAQPVPYTAGELALFKTSATAASPDASGSNANELPAGTDELAASAQRHFARQEYDAAEADYQKILARDPNSSIALANLATIELQAGKLADAEKHISAALAKSPDDAYNLDTLGQLRFRQGKYDEALNALSRAAQIDPNNPEIQNYLGVTLSHLGQRKAAEAALRRAVVLNPDYAPAHNNLAVIYLSEDPPLAELARWHYEKALAAGQPRNPDLEKMLAEKGVPVSP